MEPAESKTSGSGRRSQAKTRASTGGSSAASLSTGIYCRPSCPARTPKRENVRFFATAAAAQAAGFRACKRCRPDVSPGSPEWDRRGGPRRAGDAPDRRRRGRPRGRGRASRAAGLQRAPRPPPAPRGGGGAGPLALARAQRAQTARIAAGDDLRAVTAGGVRGRLPAACASSTRRCSEVFATTPGAAARARGAPGGARTSGAITLRLPYRAPLDGAALLAFLGRRAVPGVEEVLDGAYRRSLRLPHGSGVVELRPDGGPRQGALPAGGPPRPRRRDAARCRDAARSRLRSAGGPSRRSAGDDLHRPLVRGASRPCACPGTVDGDELAMRAVLGQQVSLAGAPTLAGRLVRALRASLCGARWVPSRTCSPIAEALAGLDPGELAMPARGRGRCSASPGAGGGDGSCSTRAPSAGRRARSCWRCRGSGRGRPSTSRCARCAIRTPFRRATSASAARWSCSGGARRDGRAQRLAERWRPYRAYARCTCGRPLAERTGRVRARSPRRGPTRGAAPARA